MARGVFTAETVLIGYVKDLVQWQLGDRKVRLYYPTAFKLFAEMRVYAKGAVTIAGGNTRLWRELAKYEDAPPDVPLNREYRRSGHLSNLTTWDVDLEGELVVVQLDDLIAKFHCTDALIAQAMGTMAARNAKRWAGDGARDLVLTALLTDARLEHARPVAMR